MTNVSRSCRDRFGFTVANALVVADARQRLMLLLAALAGLRVSEIASLRWADVEGGVLTVKGKGGGTRRVPLHPDLAAELEQWRDGGSLAYRYAITSDVWVFPSRTGQGMHPRTVSRMLSDALGAGVSGHQLRHAFATKAYRGTRDLRAVQTLLGHASPATTAIYTQYGDDALERAVLAAG